MSDNVKTAIFKKGLKSIPNFIWVLCASYALIMLTNLFVLNFAHIDADKHINRYFDIILSQQELQSHPNKELELLEHRIEKLERQSHPPTTIKEDN